MRKLNKVFALVLAFAMVLSFSACGPKKPGETKATTATSATAATKATAASSTAATSELAGTYDIKVWCPDAAVELTKTQIDNFNKTNTDGIVINATVEAVGEGEAATSMVTDVEAGADLFFFAQDQASRLIQAGAIAKLGKAASALVAEANDAGVVAAATSGDELWAYPLTADNGYFMYYDKSVIKEEHLGSLEDILADCEAAGKLFSMELEGSAWYTASFFFGTGCTSTWDLDDQGAWLGFRDDFNSPAGLVALKGMKKVLDSPAYNNSSNAPDSFAAAIPSAVVVSGTWDYVKAAEVLGDNLGTSELPSFTVDGKSYHLGSFNGCKLLGVKPQVDVKKQASIHKLAQFLTSEEAQTERFEALAWGPANLTAQSSPAVQANPGLVALFAQNAYSVPQGQIHGAWWDIGKAIAANAKAATDEAGLQAALDTYLEAMNGVIAMPADETTAFTVIGGINGDGWTVDLPMTQKPEGTWYTDEAYKLEAGVEFKVRQGKAWDVSYGADCKDPKNSPNFKVETAGYYFIKFVEGEAITLEKNSPITGWTVIGSIGGDTWTKDLAMELQADGTYKTTEAYVMEAGVEFKVRQGCAWDNSWGDGANNFVVKEAGTYYVTFDPATNLVAIVK